MFREARFADESRTTIRAVRDDGTVVNVPVAPGNRDYELIVNGDPAIGLAPTPIGEYAAAEPVNEKEF